jgi:hypothetical protein
VMPITSKRAGIHYQDANNAGGSNPNSNKIRASIIDRKETRPKL